MGGQGPVLSEGSIQSHGSQALEKDNPGLVAGRSFLRELRTFQRKPCLGWRVILLWGFGLSAPFWSLPLQKKQGSGLDKPQWATEPSSPVLFLRGGATDRASQIYGSLAMGCLHNLHSAKSKGGSV